LSGLNDLLVVMPLGELGYSRYWQMLMINRDFGYLNFTRRVLTQSGAYPHAAMNDLLKRALDAKDPSIPKWRRVLILEHDHEFPLDVFRKHAAYKEPIVAGTYVLRNIDEPLPVFYNWDAARANALHPTAAQVNKMLFESPGLHEVDVIPVGCTSIRRDVLEDWPEGQPFFSSFSNAALSTISHDVFFCRVAQDHGWQPMIDTTLQVDHYVLFPIGVPYFRNWWNQVGAKAAIERAERENGAKPVLEVVK
jgi:hypothetical protein